MNTQTALISKQNTANWRQVGLFLGLTFALTWLLNLVLWRSGFSATPITSQLLQLQMLLPAFSAILLGLFVFKGGPIYRYQERPRWFFYFFLAFTLIFALLTVLAMALPGQAATISAISGGFNILGLLILVLIRIFSGSEAFARAGLGGGKPLQWLLWGLAFVLFYALQTALNAAFGLGQASDPGTLLSEMTGGQSNAMAPGILRLVLFLQTVVVGPLLGLLMGFGEEYGWRGYLQSELIKIGKRRGVLLLGLIWGVWHYPVIWMGHNYPGQPLWGTFLMTGFTVLLGFVLGHVMLKTGSVWLVAFLHALNNQVLAYFTIAFYQASDPIFSFGIGLFGLLSMLPVVLLLLCDPVWSDQPEPLEAATGAPEPRPE